MLCLAGAVGFACAIGVHPVVGYTSLVHLLPAYLGALVMAVGLALTHGPMYRWPEVGHDRVAASAGAAAPA